jgi:hypothetical protein
MRTSWSIDWKITQDANNASLPWGTCHSIWISRQTTSKYPNKTSLFVRSSAHERNYVQIRTEDLWRATSEKITG